MEIIEIMEIILMGLLRFFFNVSRHLNKRGNGIW